MTPASKEGERGYRQAGGKGRVETVWSHAATMGSTGRNAQPGGCSGCCGPLSGVPTYCTMHAPAAQYLPRTVSHHSTPASFYLLFTTVLGRGQHFSPSGLAGNGNDNDKDRAREAGARRSAAGAGTSYLLPRCVGGCGTPYCPPRKCRLTLQLHYTASRAPCIRTWKACEIHNTHTHAPRHPPRSYLCL